MRGRSRAVARPAAPSRTRFGLPFPPRSVSDDPDRSEAFYPSYAGAGVLPVYGFSPFADSSDETMWPVFPTGVSSWGSVYPRQWNPSRPLARSRVTGFKFGARAGYRYMPALQIRVPARAYFCVQRKVRRRALFAMGRAGYSGSVKKRYYRRTANSHWRC